MLGRGAALSPAQWVGDIQGFPTGLPPGSNQNREGDSVDKALGVESSGVLGTEKQVKQEVVPEGDSDDLLRGKRDLGEPLHCFLSVHQNT